MRRLTSATAIVAAALVAVPAAAQQTFDAAGIGRGENASTVRPITDDRTVVIALTEYEPIEGLAAENPLAGLTGPCFGMFEIAGGAVEGGGYCTFDDPEGSRAIIRWTAEEAASPAEMGGSWTLLGGSGKWAGASGGGSFALTTDTDTGRFTNEVSGEVTMP